MLTTPADKYFSLCVRERAGWKCERCGNQYPELWRGIHCSHYFTRGNWSTRFEPLNAFAHCFHCHEELGNNPHYFFKWARNILGTEKYDLLVELSKDVMRGKEYRRTKGKGEIKDHYEEEYNRMRKMREEGFVGRIEFRGWL